MTTSLLTGHVRPMADQPDLAGNLLPIDREADVPDLAVSGRIPAGLRGSFVRNGPNPMFPPIGRYHMFDGDGMLHRVRFEGGRASYRNRWIRSKGLQAEIGIGRAAYPGLGDVMNFPDPRSWATPVRSRTRRTPTSSATPTGTSPCGRAACPPR